MSKIPIGATIVRAYSFVFRDFFKILSIVWLPWLGMALVSLLLQKEAVNLSQDLASGNFAKLGGAILPLIPLYFLTFFLLFMQITGITQQALGMRRGSPYYYLAINKPVWRLIGALFLSVAVIVGLYLVYMLASALFAAIIGLVDKILGLGRGMQMVMVIPFIIFFAGGYCAYVYVLFRLLFLLNPVVIAESRIDFRRSWSLGRGNFWRIFVIVLATLLPIVILFAIATYFWYGNFPPPIPTNATAAQIAANKAATAAWMIAGVKRIYDYWYILYPVSGLLTLFMCGLGCGAQSFAYRALVPETPSAPVTPD